jgi:hypothetical protein
MQVAPLADGGGGGFRTAESAPDQEGQEGGIAETGIKF